MRKYISLIILGGVCQYAVGQSTIERSFEGIDEIEISISSGDAIFEKGSNNTVDIVLEHSFNDYEPEIEKRGNTLYIKERDDSRNWSWRGDALWSFSIPDGVEIDFNTGSGDADIVGLDTEVGLNSGSGDFKFKNTKGKAKMNTGSGDIELENVEGRYKMNTGSGDIGLDDVAAEINANTGSGDIEVEGLMITGPSTFNSGSGDVEIALAGAVDYDLSLNSGSGNAELDFNGNPIEGEIVMKANKRNGRIRAPFEFDKVEEIENGRNNVTVRKSVKLGNKDIRISVSSGSGTAAIEE